MIKIKFPWESPTWHTFASKHLAPVESLADFDMRIAQRLKIRNRTVIELFNKCGYDHGDARLIAILCKIVAATKNLPQLFAQPQYFLCGAGNVELSRECTYAIVGGIFLGLFENILDGNDLKSILPQPSLKNMWVHQHEFALSCMIEYFQRGVPSPIIIHRSKCTTPPDWNTCEEIIDNVAIGDGALDDTSAKMQLVPCHRKLGGDSFLTRGTTVEELTFLIRPSAFCALLYCTEMRDDEVICIIGTVKYSAYTGISTSTKHAGTFKDVMSSGPYNKYALVFADVSTGHSLKSMFVTSFQRDCIKSYTALNCIKFESACIVAAGTWVTGYSSCNRGLRLLQQIMAAGAARKNIVYYTPRTLENEVIPFIEWANRQESLRVCDLFHAYELAIKSVPTLAELGDVGILDAIMSLNSGRDHNP